jgi:hypothetical protein
MNSYFLSISQEEKNSIAEKHRTLYNGFQTMKIHKTNESPLNVEDLALDKNGITVNSKNDVSSYNNKIYMNESDSQEVCEECGKMYEGKGETCECWKNEIFGEEEECNECGDMKYEYENIEESIQLKSKSKQIHESIEKTLDMFRRFGTK